MTWPAVPLGTLAAFAMGQAPPGAETNTDGIGTPFYRSGEFGDLRPTTRIWTTKPLRMGRRDDVFICVVGANSGEVNLGVDGAIGRSVAAISPDDRLDQRYLFHLLTSLTDDLRKGAQGSAQGVITKRTLAEISVPLPPPDEQHQIVDLLEDHLSRLDAASRAIADSLARLKALRDSTLLSVVVDAKRTGQSETHPLGELARVSSGMTPLRGNKAFYDGGTIPWITSGDLHQGLITKPTQFVTQRALDETSLKIVPAGSLLVAMYGEGKTRGTAAELGLDATTNQACAAITLHEPDLRPWIRLILDANYTGLRRLAAGGVQPNLNLSLVKAIEVPVPPADIRRMLISRITRIEEARERMKEELLSAQRRGTSLRRSLLKAAFSDRPTGTESDLSVAEETIGA